MSVRNFVLFLALILAIAVGCTRVEKPGLPPTGRIKYGAHYGDKSVPHGAIHTEARVFRSGPPSHFSKPGKIKFLVWLQAATYEPFKQGKAVDVVVDWMEVVEDYYGQKRLLYREDYNGPTRRMGLHEGGLFTRFPKWFANNNNSQLRDSSIHGGFLKLKVPCNGIAHWWTPRLPYREGARYTMRIKIKINGAGVQFGSDLWDGNRNHNGWHSDCLGKANCELSVSKWHGSTNGVFMVLVYSLPKK